MHNILHNTIRNAYTHRDANKHRQFVKKTKHIIPHIGTNTNKHTQIQTDAPTHIHIVIQLFILATLTH